MDRQLTGALSGLRRLELGDLQTYKEALNRANRICWQQYFPFLYFRYALSRKEDILISEADGAVSLFLLARAVGGAPKLYLFFLPMPMEERALDAGLERVRDFNKSKKAVVYWVDEEDLGKIDHGKAEVRVKALEKEYVYKPGRYRSLAGGEKHQIRESLNRMRARGDVEVRDFEERDSEDCLVLMDEWALYQRDKYDGPVSARGYAKRCVRLGACFNGRDLFGKVVLVAGKIRSVAFGGEIRAGLANIFVAYSDHHIKGLSRFQLYQLLLALEDYELANSAFATTPGLKYAKESLCPVMKHGMYRVQIIR